MLSGLIVVLFGRRTPLRMQANLLESATTSDLFFDWDLMLAAGRVLAALMVWTDWLRDKVSGIDSSGSGGLAGRPDRLWADRRWGHLDDDAGGNLYIGSCCGFCVVPGSVADCSKG